jgi:hypothetical protein
LYVFICAAGHSGSTLLDLLLGAHPQGFSLGEITQLPKNISLDSVCSCNEKLSDCRFWRPVITEFGRSIDIDLWDDPYTLNLGFIKAGREIDPAHQTPSRMALRKVAYGIEYARLRWQTPLPAVFRQSIEQGAKNKVNLFRFILDYTGKQFVVDSSKHYLGGLGLHRAAPDETRVIHLVRDGRAVFNSGISRGMRPDAALKAWTRHARRSSTLLEKYIPESALLTVRYEALASNPESELRRVCEFLGAEFSAQMLDFAAADSHIANGNRMRFGHTSEIRLDERWRDELPKPMLNYFERRAGMLNRQLGYND